MDTLKSIIQGKRFVGIEIFTQRGETQLALLELVQKQNELIVVKEDIRKYSDVVLQGLPKGVPVSLVVNTNQVIQKEIVESSLSEKRLLHQCFPNLSWEDFYYEIYQGKHKTILTICRKAYLDDLREVFQAHGINVSQVSLGNSSLYNLSHFYKEDTISTNLHDIDLVSTTQLVSEKKSKNLSFNLNGLLISSAQVLPFLIVLQFFFKKPSSNGNLSSLNEQLFENYYQKRLFDFSLRFMIGLLLGILLINFFFFSHYYDAYEINNRKIIENSERKQQVQLLEQRIKDKELLIAQLNGTSVVVSEVINSVSQLIPSTIQLESLIYQPINQEIKNNSPMALESNVLKITGIVSENESFSVWISKLEKLPFIDKVVIENFGKDEEKNTRFIIKVTFHAYK